MMSMFYISRTGTSLMERDNRYYLKRDNEQHFSLYRDGGFAEHLESYLRNTTDSQVCSEISEEDLRHCLGDVV